MAVNADGVWTRLAVGDTDTITGATYTGPPQAAQWRQGERIVVDEAGMLDQDTALALFTVAAETGATLSALVGDRAQSPAVGRGGVLDMAAQLRGSGTFDMAVVHRFTDPEYAEVTVQRRATAATPARGASRPAARTRADPAPRRCRRAARTSRHQQARRRSGHGRIERGSRTAE